MSNSLSSSTRLFLISTLILGALLTSNKVVKADDTMPATVSEWYDAVREKNTDKINLLVSQNFSAQSDYAIRDNSGIYFIDNFQQWYDRNNFQIISTKTELSDRDNVIVSVCYSSSFGDFQTREVFNVSDQFITKFSQQRVANKCKKT